jgi:hypothetical protein
MLTLKSDFAIAFLGEYRAIPRGTIHSAAKASGLSLPLDPISVSLCREDSYIK